MLKTLVKSCRIHWEWKLRGSPRSANAVGNTDLGLKNPTVKAASFLDVRKLESIKSDRVEMQAVGSPLTRLI